MALSVVLILRINRL